MRENLIGRTYNRLTVIEYVGVNSNRSSMWKCMCSCGKEITVRGTCLKSGKTKSCGCLRTEKIAKHGWSKTYEYESWLNMKARCYNPDAKGYDRYGGRGVTVCDRWLETETGFFNFLEDMGLRGQGLSLDRINVNGDYTPENCRWADACEQARNQRLKSSNISGVRGVYFRKRNSRWYTQITVDKKKIYLGEFITIEEAAIARVSAEIKYFGKTYNSVEPKIWDNIKHLFEENSGEG